MDVSYHILHLEIDGVCVERVRVWGKENIKLTVADFKKVYNLSDNDDYSFFLVIQSKMNNRIIPADITHKKVRQ